MATTQLEIEAAPPPAAFSAPPLSRRERWIDLALVLTVALWRPLLTSTIEFIHPRQTPFAHSDLGVAFALVEGAISVGVLAWVLWKRRSGLAGVTRSFRWRDPVIGIVLFCVADQAERLISFLIVSSWRLSTGHPPVHVPVSAILGAHVSALWFIYQFANPWVEELIVRGFLITEFTALCGTRTAIVASTLVQTSYHLYQGGVHATILSVGFLIFSIYYARTRRLGPVIAAHTIMDVWWFLAAVVLRH